MNILAFSRYITDWHDLPEKAKAELVCFVTAFFAILLVEPGKPQDRLHGIPGDDPQVGEPENAAGRGQESHAGRTARSASCVQNEHMRLFSLVCTHVDKLSA